MIGYYVHHHGLGHLHRATTIAKALRDDVTGLSSLPRPAEWPGEWEVLPRDDASASIADADAGGRLHWAPLHDEGVRNRAARLSAWIDESAPSVVVSDVSVEAAVLARLHGVPVVSMALPGQRTDPAHELGYGLSRAIIGAWPTAVSGMLVSQTAVGRLHSVGAISRFPTARDVALRPRSVLVLSGAGRQGSDWFPIDLARAQSPGWHWEVLGSDSWSHDPWDRIRSAEVIVTHAGQNSLAEVAAARRPAVVIPQVRPFDEQVTTAAALTAAGLPAVVLPQAPTTGWRDLLAESAALDGSQWRIWNDGGGAERAARIIEDAAGPA